MFVLISSFSPSVIVEQCSPVLHVYFVTLLNLFTGTKCMLLSTCQLQLLDMLHIKHTRYSNAVFKTKHE